MSWRLYPCIPIAGLVAAMLTGCGGKKQARVNPPPPPMAAPPVATVTVPPSTPKRTEATPQSKVDKKQEKADEIARELSVPEAGTARPITIAEVRMAKSMTCIS